MSEGEQTIGRSTVGNTSHIDPTEVEVKIRSINRSEEPHQRELYLKAVRQIHGLSAAAFAKKAGILEVSYREIERGNRKISDHVGNANKIIYTIGKLSPEGDVIAEGAITHVMAATLPPVERARIDDLLEPFPGKVVFDKKTHTPPVDTLAIADPETEVTEEQKWFDTIKQIPFGEAVWFLRVASSQTRAEFAEECGISVGELTFVEEGKRGLRLPYVNRIIDTTFDPDGEIAQLLRLKSQNYDVMTLEDLQNASIGKVFDYIRTLQGQERSEVGKKLFKSENTVRDIELGRVLGSRLEDDMTNRWLDLPPDSTWRKVIRHKIISPDEPINAETLQGVMHERFLIVADSQDNNEGPPLSTDDSEVMDEIQSKETLGQAIKFLRERKNIGSKKMSQRSLAALIQRRSFTHKEISYLEQDKQHLRDYRLFALLEEGLGYDIHHPVAQYMLRRNYQEKKVRDKTRVPVNSLQNLTKRANPKI
ncbi:MAG: helix-turn-helix domain-containing protein [Candidatus Levyibacteriota bacterium]